MLYTISKGELGVVRTALEEGDASDREDALGIVKAIYEKNVTITITEDQMYKDPLDAELTDEELAILAQADKEAGFDEN